MKFGVKIGVVARLMPTLLAFAKDNFNRDI